MQLRVQAARRFQDDAKRRSGNITLMRKDSLANQKPEDQWKWLFWIFTLEFCKGSRFSDLKICLRVDEGPNSAEKKLKIPTYVWRRPERPQ